MINGRQKSPIPLNNSFSLVKIKVDLPEKCPRKKMTLFSNMAKQYLRSDESTSTTTTTTKPFSPKQVGVC
jgi:hypothetical protein